MEKDTTASVLAELASYGEFLPGSVRRTAEKRKRTDGRIKTYEAQPIYTYTDPDTRKQVSRRIPKGCFDRVRGLTMRYRGFKKLIARFEAAAVRENLDDDSKKKLLAVRTGICCTNIAKVIDEFRSRPKDGTAEDLDAKVAAAFREDARGQIAAMASAVAESCKASRTQTHRTASVLTCCGRISFRFPYAPRAGVAVSTLGRLGCSPGEVRATPEARRIVAESCASLDSFQEAQTFLRKRLSIDASVASMIAMTRKSAELTRRAWAENALVAERSARPSKKLPEGAKCVGPTLVVSVDGTCAPATHADTAGIRGRAGDEAGSREIKVAALGMYTHVDGSGRPILRRGDVWYYASECSCDELESIMNNLARRRDIGKIGRVQFIGDGASWIQKIWEHAFKSCGAIRTLDFAHAASYLHALLEPLSETGELAADYRRFKGIMRKWGGESLMRSLAKRFGTRLNDLKGDAQKALAYLRGRIWMMDYRRLRRDGYYIGSGIIESACKTVVGARCKLAGMHWRHKNAGGISLLRATMRSNFKIAA